jgi:glucoamylase
MGVGTAYTYELRPEDNPSKVWFTLADGAITEVTYPTIDMANVKEMTCLISDGKSFIHNETEDCLHTVSLLDKQALAYRVVSVDKEGRYRLIKEVVTDPANHTLLVQVGFEALQGEPADYRLYLYYVPHIRNSGEGDSGCVDQETGTILAWDRDIYAALKVRPHWLHASLRDGLADADDALPAGNGLGRPTDKVRNSRLAFVLKLPTTEVCTITLGFGSSAQAAGKAADVSLVRGFEPIKQAYIAAWQRYCRSLDTLDGRATDLYYLSAMVVKAHEDKTHRGAIVASPSLPWGNRRPDEEEYRGYRYVWPRDLYHSAMALLAIGDKETVADILRYLDEVLQETDGSFPQNAYVDGTPYSQSIQMDEVAAPILIAWWLEATDYYQSLVKPAADYIVEHGPSTPQERWEENNGYSPATIAAEIAGLICAADLARRAGDVQSADLYLSVADEWQEKVEKWCFTTNGLIGDGRHYLRISPEGDPNTECVIKLAHNGGLRDQREVVDPSFLELVRLGVKAPDDPCILESLPKVDQMIKVVTPRGPSWYRYNFDGYGEAKEGGTFPGKGHLWTLLTGERGMYELARGTPDEAKLCLETMERFANEGGMLPEQVWEETGKGTGSATPLVWAHAEYIVLLKSIVTGDIADRPGIVYDRYVGCSPARLRRGK